MNQLFLPAVEGVDGQIYRTRIVDKNGDGRIVALLPIRPIFLLRVKDLGAVVETVAMADVRVEKEIWGIVKSEVVVR